MVWLKRLRGSVGLGLGYLLSPLSWWNDVVFNLPIAYGFAYLVTLGQRQWLWPATVIGYWLSNVLGMVMMQWGAADLVMGDRESNWRRDLIIGLASSTAYTAIAAGLVYFNILRLPEGLRLG